MWPTITEKSNVNNTVYINVVFNLYNYQRDAEKLCKNILCNVSYVNGISLHIQIVNRISFQNSKTMMGMKDTPSKTQI